nr:hypothetical protein [Tanacetum cinerariifolium]
MRTRSAGRPASESLGGGMGVRVVRSGMGRRPRVGNDERVDDLNGQVNDQGMGANGGVEGVNENAGHAAFTDRFHELARLVPHLVTPESRKIKRNRSIKKVEKRGNMGEPSKDKNGRDDNKRTRTGNTFATTANPVGRENDYRGVPRNVNHVNTKNPHVRACYKCGSTDHVRSACPRWNRAQGPGGSRPNQVVANNKGQGHGKPRDQARGRAFMLRVEEARHDPNIMTGTFTLNEHFTTTLFDSGADYSFVSTTFIPLLCIKPSELGFRYEIEIASGKLVEINKIISPRMRTRSAGRPASESLGGGMGVRVGRSGMGRKLRVGNDERVDELNGQVNDQGMGANGGVEGVNENVERAKGEHPTSQRSNGLLTYWRMGGERWECVSEWKPDRFFHIRNS